MWPVAPAMVDTPISRVEDFESPKYPLVVLPTCAVTRAMSHADFSSDFDNSDKKRESVFLVSAFPLPVSCSDFVKEQKEDPSL